jgi:hypothetical protein
MDSESRDEKMVQELVVELLDSASESGLEIGTGVV